MMVTLIHNRVSQELKAGIAEQEVYTLIMHKGRVVRDMRSIDSPRQSEAMRQVQGKPKDPFRNNRRHGWRL